MTERVGEPTNVVLINDRVGYHSERLKEAYVSIRSAFFVFVDRLLEARNDLGEDAFQKDLAVSLEMSPSTLSKFLQIAQSKRLMAAKDQLPPTLTTLYQLTVLEKKLEKENGPEKGGDDFAKFLTKKVTPHIEAAAVTEEIRKVDDALRKAKKIKREKQILAISGTTTETTALDHRMTPWHEVIGGKMVFRTMLMAPTDQDASWLSDDGVFETDVAERFPLFELRAPPPCETVQGFVYCAARYLKGGLKLLSAAGFNYRDVFVPSTTEPGLRPLRTDGILLRGERGAPTSYEMTEFAEASEEGALGIAGSLGNPPRLYVFAEDAVEGWVCTSPT